MEIIPIDGMPDKFKIYLLSCIHIGSSLHHEGAFKDVIDKIATEKNSYVDFLGDNIEAFGVDDPRFDLATRDKNNPLPLQQANTFIDRVEPIKKKILSIKFGNHEYKYFNRFGDIVKDVMCKQLKVRYGGFSSVFLLKDDKGKLRFELYTTHGKRRIGSVSPYPSVQKGNELKQLVSALHKKYGYAQVMARGHSHRLLHSPPNNELYLYAEGESRLKQAYHTNPMNVRYIHPYHRDYLCVGSFLKNIAVGVTSYSEVADYDPVELGYAVIHYDKGDIHCEEVRV